MCIYIRRNPACLSIHFNWINLSQISTRFFLFPSRVLLHLDFPLFWSPLFFSFFFLSPSLHCRGNRGRHFPIYRHHVFHTRYRCYQKRRELGASSRWPRFLRSTPICPACSALRKRAFIYPPVHCTPRRVGWWLLLTPFFHRLSSWLDCTVLYMMSQQYILPHCYRSRCVCCLVRGCSKLLKRWRGRQSKPCRPSEIAIPFYG